MVGVALTIKSMEKLTLKQQRFCEEYLLDLNGAQAAIRAGYKPKAAKEQASRLLTKANVQEYLQSLRDVQKKKLGIDAEWILREFVGILEIAKAAVDVKDKDGNSLGVYKADLTNANRAVENIMKLVIGDKAKEGEEGHDSTSTTTITITHKWASLESAFIDSDSTTGSQTQGTLPSIDCGKPVDPIVGQGRVDH